MAASLPLGWGDRTNSMSEKDMQLGGVAATKFARKSGVYENGDSTYKSSEQVRAFYHNKKQQQQQQQQSISKQQQPSVVIPSLPVGWEERQKARDMEEKQYRVFAASTKEDPAANTTTSTAPTKATSLTEGSAEEALLHVTIFTLEKLADSLESSSRRRGRDQSDSPSLPLQHRVAFADAVKRVMNAMNT